MKTASTEREAIVAWHEDQALALPKMEGLRGFVWAVFHSREFWQNTSTFWAHVNSAKAIARGDHLKDQDGRA